jgi:hypothetical protein
MKIKLLYIFCLFNTIAQSQDVVVFGVVTSADRKQPLEFVIVNQKGVNKITESDSTGGFRLVVNAGEPVELVFTRLGYQETSIKLDAMKSGVKRYLSVSLAEKQSNLEVVINASRIQDGGMVREEVTEFKLLPDASGNFESMLPHIALGVSSGTGGELSSQYSVRGGNYDENLIYVNDFEIFRPQLIRAGQQEGLTFPNADLIRDITFSSGGYQARYGDKMSSVLDVRYKRPDDFHYSLSGSLLGASAHFEGSKRIGPNAYNKLRYLVGARYKTNRYLLGSLDVKGEYVPDFIDLQSYLTYDFNKTWQFGWITNYNDSRYNFTPSSRSTALGLINFALKLTTVFEGQERDKFVNGMTGLSLSYVPTGRKNPLYLKFLSSAYSSSEQENFDILGYYRLGQIETDFGSNSFGQEIALLGVGTQHTYARNYLYYTIRNLEHKGGLEISTKLESNTRTNFIQWGVKAQQEYYDDFINEWERVDSADYSLPQNGVTVNLANVLKSSNVIENTKINGFLQNAFTIEKPGAYRFNTTFGFRASYLSLAKEMIYSPRVSIGYEPLGVNNNLSLSLSGGIYYQSPFYRELRRLDGTLNANLRSQRSTHLVGAISYDFDWKNVSAKPFKLISEIYYKSLRDLISYDIDNVRIRYAGENNSTGYATGLDLRINGEFVPGAESWLNIGILRTHEQINGITHLRRTSKDTLSCEVSTVPRPTDRLVTVNLFFQDYLPKNENFKVNLNLSFGTGLPFGIKDDNLLYRNTYRFKEYQRVDVGFLYVLWDEKKAAKATKKNLFSHTKSSIISLEVFNMLGVANPASNTWIKTITNTQYAITNNLTSRRLNLRFRAEF